MNEDVQRKINLARGLNSLGNKNEAVVAYNDALNIQSGHLDALIELGFLLWELGRIYEAEDISNKLIASKPSSPAGYFLCGHCLVEKGEINEAIGVYKKIFEIMTPNADIYNALALALKEGGRLNEALYVYDKALLLAPQNAEIHNNRAILSLLLGNYRSGFEEYEWRKYTQHKFGNRQFDKPLWLGENLQGKTLLVHHEQGLGDGIQFSRYVKQLYESGIKILYAAHPALKKLLSCIGAIEFTDFNNPSTEFDYHCPLLSLPLRMNTDIESMANLVPYISVETERLDRWQKRIGADGFKVGVAWQGSGGRFAKNRLFPVSQLERLQEIRGVRLIGLHQVPLYTSWDLPDGLKIESLGPDFDLGSDAFLDTAAAIQCCDLIISCDTAIAHLAGALGRKAWVVLRHVPHWVWMVDRTDSPWYPSITLFRQKKAGDWDSVFTQVYLELQKIQN